MSSHFPPPLKIFFLNRFEEEMLSFNPKKTYGAIAFIKKISHLTFLIPGTEYAWRIPVFREAGTVLLRWYFNTLKPKTIYVTKQSTTKKTTTY